MSSIGTRTAGLAASKHGAAALASTGGPSLQAVRHKHYLLMYDYVENIIEKRAPFRADHLAHATKYAEAGHLRAGGAYDGGVGAAVHFECDDQQTVEEFVKNDPYFKNGLVPSYKIHEWTVVVQSAP